MGKKKEVYGKKMYVNTILNVRVTVEKLTAKATFPREVIVVYDNFTASLKPKR